MTFGYYLPMPQRDGSTGSKLAYYPFCAVILAATLCSCGTLDYYRQAIVGHWDLMNRRVPLDELIAAPDTDVEFKRKLKVVAAAREYAIRELKLPDNGSYRSYADLGRDHVVWNVFAAPELSLEPVLSCFLFVGCLSYRGFFDEAAARRFGTSLTAAGYDVFIGGVAAYSTLGWFDDPVLNTMLVWDDVRIAKVIFHELAHQLIYVADDTVFNESFATAVALIGIERLLERDTEAQVRHARDKAREQQFFELLLDFRAQLETVYNGADDDDTKRAKKHRLFDVLLIEYRTRKISWDGYDGYDAWMRDDLNNAKMTSIATYHDYVPGFRSILTKVNDDLSRFYAAVERLAKMSLERRKQCLSGPKSNTQGGDIACINDLIDRQ